MGKYFDLRTTVLIVVGHGILPEEEDRPIAYELKRTINARGGGLEGRSAVVVSDVWIMNQELGEFFPAIPVGGPGGAAAPGLVSRPGREAAGCTATAAASA